jgi:hypothetical protein
MNNCDDIFEKSEDLPASLPRTSSTTDFSKLFRRRRHARKPRSRRSQSLAPSERSEAYGSENSQVLYMAPQKRRKTRDRSLSCISNGSARRLDVSSDTKDDIGDEELSWNIIDQEIFEWQYVCQTGRPYWWSPAAKSHRLKKLQPRLKNEPSSRIWMKEIDERPKPVYGAQRRAVSDSYLSDPSTIQDLAHLVAIQLLGACFTLSPESIVGLPSPDYTSLDRSSLTRFPDPRMISSLRMHTNFRYSPSFGHQPRNTSPVEVWPGLYDGPSRNPSPPAANTGVVTPNIGTSGSLPKRSRVRRALHVTEGSDSLGSDIGEFDSCCSKKDLGPTVAKTAWHRRQGSNDVNYLSTRFPRLLSSTSRGSKQAPSTNGDDMDGSQVYRGVQTLKWPLQTNYRLQPMIRSEPHHVFVQPVKELVVKRWRSFTRRFGGSLHSALPTSQSEYQTSASDSGESEASSPGISSDSKLRRLRAQERGDIHSSSVDSTPHFNSPASGVFSPNPSGRVSPYWIDSPNAPTLPLADSPVAAASPAAAQTAPSTKIKKSILETSSTSEALIFPQVQTGPTSSALTTCGSGHSKMEFPFPSSSYSYSSRKTVNRQRRRSMLSEVCTPEDFRTSAGANAEGSEVVEKSILSAVGSTLASPRAEVPPSAIAQGRRQGYQDAMASPSFAGFMGMTDIKGISIQERPRVTRTSTNGTQVFTPRDDGVELDGLPVGPERSLWATKGVEERGRTCDGMPVIPRL